MYIWMIYIKNCFICRVQLRKPINHSQNLIYLRRERRLKLILYCYRWLVIYVFVCTQMEIPKVELVKGMGIMVKGTTLASVLSKSKRQPTRLLRFLMSELFTEDELRFSTVRGKKGKLPALDQDVMNAILC